jgi:uncharacterized protein
MGTEQDRQLAVVTGASSGIGFELAKVFAEEGFDLLIAAEDAELTLALEASKETDVSVEAHRVDLATETELADELKLFTSSIAATIPGAFQAVYNASKSFVQSFALALRNELKDTDIAITSLMPGATETEFLERAGMEDTEVGAGEKDDPAEVARQGFDALMADKEKVVAGALKNRVQVAAGRVIPDSVKAEQHRKMAEPGSAEEEDR